ncbi:MAG: YaaR family protein [Syntrophomonadaceae bacterium]|nr:YaaR family protein [Syntrophomonadaceae bacterium]MDD3023205.1 YaaR family protein [Syntrophomonadaceae bacterium]
MKIDRDKKGVGSFKTLGKADVREVKRGSESAFDQELTQHREAASRFKMEEILKDLERLGDKLNNNLNINDLMLYKKRVKNFLQEATAQAYILKQERGRNRRGRTMLTTIATIDSEVEMLIEDFIKKKKEPMEVLELLDKIRGMLVDLMI